MRGFLSWSAQDDADGWVMDRSGFFNFNQSRGLDGQWDFMGLRTIVRTAAPTAGGRGWGMGWGGVVGSRWEG